MTDPGAPGWYPDGSGTPRWWDGTKWTSPPLSEIGAAAQPSPPRYTSPGGGSPLGGFPPGGGYLPPTPPTPAPTGAGRFTGDTGTGTLVHVLAIFFPILGPLVVYLIEKDKSPFGRHNAAEALNFGITVFLGLVVSAVLAVVVIGAFTALAIVIAALVLHIVAAVAASKGEWYRYPLTLRLIS